MIKGLNDPLTLLRNIARGLTTGNKALGQPREVTSDGSVFVQLANVACDAVVFSNGSEAAFLIRRGNAGTVFITIPASGGKVMDVAANANELWVKRAEAGDDATMTYELNGESVS